MTFKVGNLGSKQPYFNRAYEVRVYSFMVRTLKCIWFQFEQCERAAKRKAVQLFSFASEGNLGSNLALVYAAPTTTESRPYHDNKASLNMKEKKNLF